MNEDEAWGCSRSWLRGEQCEICKETMTKDKALKLARDWIAQRPSDRPVSTGKMISIIDRALEALAQPKPLTLNEMSAIEEKVYMQTINKGRPLFEYAQSLIRATEAAHGIKGVT